MSAKPRNKSSSDYELRVHRDWINTLQPVGLVVSAPALVAAQVFPDRNITAKQQTLRSLFPPLQSDAAGPSDRASRSPLAGRLMMGHWWADGRVDRRCRRSYRCRCRSLARRCDQATPCGICTTNRVMLTVRPGRC